VGKSYALSQGQSVTCTSLHHTSWCSLRSKSTSSSQISKRKFENVKHMLPESKETRKQRKSVACDLEYTLFVIAYFLITAANYTSERLCDTRYYINGELML